MNCLSYYGFVLIIPMRGVNLSLFVATADETISFNYGFNVFSKSKANVLFKKLHP
jgi:hypothetical protein